MPPTTYVHPAAVALKQGFDRSRWVGRAMYLYLAVAAVDVAATVWRLFLLNQLLAEGATDTSSLMALPFGVRDETIADLTGPANDLATSVAWAVIVSTVLLAVVYLRWQSLARANAVVVLPDAVRYGGAAAIWCWFVPIWSFFGPKIVINDLWRASDPQLRIPGTVSPPSWLLGWWLPYLAGTLISRFAGEGVVSVGGAIVAEYAYLVATALLIVSGVLLIRLTRAISARQIAKAANLGLVVPV